MEEVSIPRAATGSRAHLLQIVCVGSVGELERLSGITGIVDIHREKIDHITIPSQKGTGVLKRVDEVFDCWFESGRCVALYALFELSLQAFLVCHMRSFITHSRTTSYSSALILQILSRRVLTKLEAGSIPCSCFPRICSAGLHGRI